MKLRSADVEYPEIPGIQVFHGLGEGERGAKVSQLLGAGGARGKALLELIGFPLAHLSEAEDEIAVRVGTAKNERFHVSHDLPPPKHLRS